MRDREPARDIGPREEIDAARIGQLGDHDRGGLLEQLREVRARRQQLADGPGEPRGTLLALALGDLDHDRAELDRDLLRAAHRVEAGEPVALDPGLRRGLAGDLDVGDRCTLLEDRAQHALDLGPDVGEHLGDPPAQVVLDRDAVDLGERLVQRT